MSKEGSENDIREGDEEAQVQENFEQHENGNKQVNGLQHDDANVVMVWSKNKGLSGEELNAIL